MRQGTNDIITVFIVLFKSSATFMCVPDEVTSLGVKRKVWNALKAGAIVLPLKLSFISCNFDFIDIINLFLFSLNLTLLL